MLITLRNKAFLFVSILAILNFYVYPQTIKFNSLTIKDGLSSNKVNTLIQDHFGFIWFGTDDGLNRYDGYNLKIYKHNPSDSNSISDNNIWALLEDRHGKLWIGTKAGTINLYDPETDKFTHFKIKSTRTNQNSITAIYEDKKGNIWIGTRRDGVYKYLHGTMKYDHFKSDTNNIKSLSYKSVRSIIEDKQGNILVGTYYGFNKFDPNYPSLGFKRYYNISDNPRSLGNNQIYNLSRSVTDSNIIWIGTPSGLTEYNSKYDSFRRIKIPNPNKLQFGSGASTVIEEIINNEKYLWIDTYSGLLLLNELTGKATRFVHSEYLQHSLINNQINKIMKDRSGVIWIATENGISYLTSKSTKFNSPFNRKLNIFIQSLKNYKNLRSIVEYNKNKICFGFADGLIVTNRAGEKIQTIHYAQGLNLNVWSLSKDDNNNLWIGTFGQGLKTLDIKSGKIKNWLSGHPEIKSNAALFTKSILNDSDGNIWAGFWGFGIIKIISGSKRYNYWNVKTKDINSINIGDIWSIKEDRFGRIWFGTQGGGLNLLVNKKEGTFRHWLHSEGNINSLSSNSINCILVENNYNKLNDSTTILWIGTNNGLNKFQIINLNHGQDIYNFKVDVRSFNNIDGLANNSVNSIIEDNNGNLWVGTGAGISKFDTKTKHFINFSSEDGINGTRMNYESALMLSREMILFGSTKGINIFTPKNITLSKYKPNLVFTDFQIFDKSVKIGNNSPLKKSIQTTKHITLSHLQNVFSFKFAALDYNSKNFVQYTYKMEGFDKKWIKSGTRRFVTYTNLYPGKYTFKVKATNADGVWNNNVASINIILEPPWWKTWWAYGFYVTVFLVGLWEIRCFELNRTKLRNELKLRDFEVRKKSELEKLKSRFFANLSHEFRTPLMLIKGPIEQLKKGKTDQSYFENIEIIERNSNRLKNLIDQLLELTQLEKASIPLKAKGENLIYLLKIFLSAFDSLAKGKNISLVFESEVENLICWIDKDKFEKIINNLISNAIKFTPESGKVTITVCESSINRKSIVEVKISDTGVSIPPDKIGKIFDRFFQVDNTNYRTTSGSGIGLALVKELVDLHKWQISVKSELGTGTEFILKIPLGEDYLSQEEKALADSEKYLFKGHLLNNKNLLKSLPREQHKQKVSKHNKLLILIVDDSEDVRKYLRGLLINDYNISEAPNGILGIKAATESIPDLIISDVMMPSMDGLEFCRTIKSKWQTSDIPIILLTARASFESKLEGLHIGADDYLIKPFEPEELFARIKNLIDQRNRLKNKYSNNFDPFIEKKELVTADDEFIKKAIELIETNFDNVNFGVEELADKLAVSRTQLHRKISSITSQSPGVFIRSIKLKHAAKLLVEAKLSITQIAYEIGFSGPGQFTRAFKKQFDCLPSEYSNKYKNHKKQ